MILNIEFLPDFISATAERLLQFGTEQPRDLRVVDKGPAAA
jgi:hypothetical protein